MEDLHAVHTEQCWGPSISPLDSRPINQEVLGGGSTALQLPR